MSDGEVQRVMQRWEHLFCPMKRKGNNEEVVIITAMSFNDDALPNVTNEFSRFGR